MRMIRQEMRTAIQEMESLIAQAANEKRSLTAEEKNKFEELDNRVKELSDVLERQRQVEQRSSWLSEQETAAHRPRLVDTTQQNDELQFRSAGEQLSAILQVYASHGTRIDPRLRVRAATGLGEESGGIGGYLLQPQYSAELLQKIYNIGEIVRRCTHFNVNVGSNELRIPTINESSRADGSRWGGVRGYWLSEGSAKTASKPTFGQVALTLQKLAAVIYITDELINDVPNLMVYLDQIVPDELNFMLEQAVISGTGTGQPLGILNAAAPTVAVHREVANSISLNDVHNMWSKLYPSSQRNAVWLVSPSAYGELLQIAYSGFPVLQPIMYQNITETSTANPVLPLMGRPVIVSEYLPALGSKGDVVLADFTQYVLASKPIETAISVDAAFLSDETIMRFVYRVNGRPWWSSTLTMGDGSTTAPFVALDVPA